MSPGRDYESYAAKMRHHADAGTDMDVDVRFIDMMSKRYARVLDIGCGIGNAVNGLRARGHAAYGIDPTPEVLEVAGDLYARTWFRQMAAADATPELLALNGFPRPTTSCSCLETFRPFFQQTTYAQPLTRWESYWRPGVS